MSVGAEVDALALMMDGAVVPIGRYTYKNVYWLEMLGTESALHYRSREWPDVAEAILELEAWADWWHIGDNDDRPFLSGYKLSSLAAKAHRHASRYASDEILLEAAALLRDGWRP